MQQLSTTQHEELLMKFKSQKDLHRFLSIVSKQHPKINILLVDLHLPKQSQCSLEFLQ